MPTVKSPPADPLIEIIEQPDGSSKIYLTSPWRHWLNSLIVDQQDNISDAETSHAVTSFNETNTALDAIGTIINSILDILEANKEMSES